MKKTLKEIGSQIIEVAKKEAKAYDIGSERNAFNEGVDCALRCLNAYPSQPERVEGVFKVGDTAIVTHEDTNRKYKVGDSFVVAVEYEGDFDDSESGTGQCIGEGGHRGMIWASNCKLLPAAPSAVDWDEVEKTLKGEFDLCVAKSIEYKEADNWPMKKYFDGKVSAIQFMATYLKKHFKNTLTAKD